MSSCIHLDYLDLASNEDGELWWERFSEYIREIDGNSYFQSEEYKNNIVTLNQREKDPLFAVLLKMGNRIVGLCAFVVYEEEDGKSFILEFGIAKPERKKHLGTAFYELIEWDVASRGGRYIDLTAGDSVAESFWRKQGFILTEDISDNGLHIMRKSLIFGRPHLVRCLLMSQNR